MSQKSGKAAKSTYAMADRRRRQILWTGLIGVAALLVAYSLLKNAHSLGLGGGVMLILLFAFRLIPDLVDVITTRQQKAARRAIRGARAEERVESILDGLDEGFLILHDVTSPYGNIDHIVIAQDGRVFLVETKAHGGKVLASNGELSINGHPAEKDFIGQCLKNTYWLRDQISQLCGVKPWITPLLVFVNAFVVDRPILRGVRVLNRKYLVQSITQAKPAGPGVSPIWEKREMIIHTLVGN